MKCEKNLVGIPSGKASLLIENHRMKKACYVSGG